MYSRYATKLNRPAAYMALSNVAISVGNYWPGAVAEHMNYRTALYLDSALVVLALRVIPVLENRENRKQPGAAAKKVALADLQQ